MCEEWLKTRKVKQIVFFCCFFLCSLQLYSWVCFFCTITCPGPHCHNVNASFATLAVRGGSALCSCHQDYLEKNLWAFIFWCFKNTSLWAIYIYSFSLRFFKKTILELIKKKSSVWRKYSWSSVNYLVLLQFHALINKVSN